MRVTGRFQRALPNYAGSTIAPVLVLTQITSLQVGSAVAKNAYELVSPTALAGMRLAFSAVIMCLLVRPRLSQIVAHQWRAAIWLGVTFAAMNLAYFQAISYLPISVASTLELLGPLALSVVLARRLAHLVSAVLAIVGVLLLTVPGAALPTTGMLLGAAAALCRAAYVILNQHVGRVFVDWTGLTVALAIGACLLTPLVAITDAAAIVSRPEVLGIGLAVAVLSSLIPYSLDMAVLRRIGKRGFGVLLALSPAVAAVVGFALLGEHLRTGQIVGIALVVLAVAWSAARSRPAEPSPPSSISTSKPPGGSDR